MCGREPPYSILNHPDITSLFRTPDECSSTLGCEIYFAATLAPPRPKTKVGIVGTTGCGKPAAEITRAAQQLCVWTTLLGFFRRTPTDIRSITLTMIYYDVYFSELLSTHEIWAV